ncbi:MAG: hypothetical protein QOK37_731 [Thermoanaerobaculia bacterium]|nr:hypothetical protein [Thermoanaerobaculia bacterium]
MLRDLPAVFPKGTVFCRKLHRFYTNCERAVLPKNRESDSPSRRKSCEVSQRVRCLGESHDNAINCRDDVLRADSGSFCRTVRSEPVNVDPGRHRFRGSVPNANTQAQPSRCSRRGHNRGSHCKRHERGSQDVPDIHLTGLLSPSSGEEGLTVVFSPSRIIMPSQLLATGQTW